MVLLITREIPPTVARRAAQEHEVRQLIMHGVFNPTIVLESADRVNAILCTPADYFNSDLIKSLPRTVKVIATYSVGIEHIDIEAAANRNIEICHTPDVLSTATAELALTLMLMAARRAGEGERLLRAGNWHGITPVFHLGRGVVGKVLGIFGMGRIGRELAAMARGLNMTVHYRNRSRLTDTLELGSIYHDNDRSFLNAIDFLSINAPGGNLTKHWLNEERLNQLRPGAIVVNTGRGSTVDDEALIYALRSGRVAAAGLDVFNNEPRLNSAYLDLENVVLLPHIGSATIETRDAMGFLALDGILRALNSDNTNPNS